VSAEDQPPEHVLAQFGNPRSVWGPVAAEVKGRSPDWKRIHRGGQKSARNLAAMIRAGASKAWEPDEGFHFEVVYDKGDPQSDWVWARYVTNEEV
jgi:hypothetical protein